MLLIIKLLILSFLADQLLQFKIVRQKKHKSTLLLAAHVLTWGIPMFAAAILMCIKFNTFSLLGWWVSITAIHFIVEWAFIRMWTYLWYDKKRSAMVTCILLEQLIINVLIIFFFYIFK